MGFLVGGVDAGHVENGLQKEEDRTETRVNKNHWRYLSDSGFITVANQIQVSPKSVVQELIVSNTTRLHPA